MTSDDRLITPALRSDDGAAENAAAAAWGGE